MLAHQILTNEHATKTAVVAHGILGSRRNLVGFIKKLLPHTPNFEYLLIDLRNHGESPHLPSPNRLADCARDVKELCDALRKTPTTFIGHSFGGKVALAYAQNYPLEKAIILDAVPGVARLGEDLDKSSVAFVVRILEQIAIPISSRQSLVMQLMQKGVPKSIALWMTTNLKDAPDGLRWAFNLENVKEMLEDYATTSFWHLLEEDHFTQYYFVRAALEKRWTLDVLNDFKRIAKSNVHIDLLENAGHFVHIDNPEGLIRLLVRMLNS